MNTDSFFFSLKEIFMATKEKDPNVGPNGKYYPPAKAEKHVEKVVTGSVTTRRKPLSKKFADVFLSSDMEDVKSYIVFDVIIPGIKDAIFDTISILLYGDARSGSSKRNSNQTYVSYSGYSSPKTKPKQSASRSRRDRTVTDIQDIIFESRGEAEEVLGNLVDFIVDYGVATVADLYDLVGITGPFTDNKYGWTDLSMATVVRVRDGYLINLPRAVAID